MALMPQAATTDPLWHNQLDLLLQSTGEGIFGIDLDGHCMFINRAGAQMLGYAPAAVLGHNMHELTHHSHADGSHYPDTDCPIFNAFRRGLPCRLDTEVFWRADRTAFAVEYSSYPILDGQHVRGAVITFVDITERKRAGDELQRVNAQLRLAKEELELRVQERTGELSQALQSLRELSAYSEQVREEERTRIAREVHDELGSLLVALKMDVNWLDRRLGESGAAHSAPNEALRSKCQHMSTLIEGAVDNVGRIITDLRPSILDHQGLWAALDWQAHEFARTAELVLDWQIDVLQAPELPEPQAMAVFRIFQEMLSNVGRHAHATHLSVHIRADANTLALTVADNGCGAPPEAFEAANAYGVMGMRERARLLNSKIEISSQIGLGSTFRLLGQLSKLEQNRL